MNDTGVIQVDSELARIACITGNDRLFMMWSVARWLDSVGVGKVDVDQLRELMVGRGRYSERRFNDLIQAGRGLFWLYVKRTNGLRITGIRKLAVALTGLAGEVDPATVETKMPGRRPTSIPLEEFFAPVGEFRATMYSAWIGERGRTMSRDVLMLLWRASKTTLRRWERSAGITATPQFGHITVQSGELPSFRLPGEGRTTYIANCGAGKFEIRTRWQLPNHYQSGLNTHAHLGQARKITVDIQNMTGKADPVVYVRLYLPDQKAFEQAVARPGAATRYLYLGREGSANIFDLPDKDGYPQTELGERASAVDAARYRREESAKRTLWLAGDKNVTHCSAVVSTAALVKATLALAKRVLDRAYDVGRLGRKSADVYFRMLARLVGDERMAFIVAVCNAGVWGLPRDVTELVWRPERPPEQLCLF